MFIHLFLTCLANARDKDGGFSGQDWPSCSSTVVEVDLLLTSVSFAGTTLNERPNYSTWDFSEMYQVSGY